MSVANKFNVYLKSIYFEIFKGPGYIKLKAMLLSPVGLLGSFFIFLSMALPFLPNTITIVNLLWYVFYYIIIAQSFNIIGGYGGEIDFGHVVFVGIGTYTVAILYGLHGVNIWLSIILAGFVSALAALILGIPILKLRGAYFAVTMLAVAHTMGIIVSYFSDFTGGGSGIFIGLLLKEVPNLRLYSYFAVILVSILAFFITHYLSHTRLGLSLRAIKESPDGAASIGINVLRTKIIAFMISAFLAGLAGGVFMIRILNIQPLEAFSARVTEEMIIITMLGGPGSVFGPVIGALIVVPLRTTLIRWLTGLTVTVFGLTLKLEVAYLLIYGMIYILAVLFLPKGIMGWLQDKGFVKRESLVEDQPDDNGDDVS